MSADSRLMTGKLQIRQVKITIGEDLLK